MSRKSVIGRDTKVDFGDKIIGVPAKVDTGADSSAVWASEVFVDKTGKLHFKLFGKKSRFYTGEDIVKENGDYTVTSVKSASGENVIKYNVRLPVVIEGKELVAKFGLSKRSTHNYPILIGRRTLLKGKFIVDVSKKSIIPPKKKSKTLHLNEEMNKNPYKFYKEQYLNGSK